MNILRSLIIVSILTLLVVLPAYAEDDPLVRLTVKAKIKSNVHIEWEKLPDTDPRYIAFAKNRTTQSVKKNEKIILLPFALLVKLRTNDPTKIVKIHVENLKSEGGKRIIPVEKLSVSINGGSDQFFIEDIALLQQQEGSELKELALLFCLQAQHHRYVVSVLLQSQALHKKQPQNTRRQACRAVHLR